jgi:MFS family permease
MKLYRLALWTGLGSGLEYYAFICFALQAKIIAILFFHQQNTALMNTFLIFAGGSVLSLAGGIVWGWLGDRFGRKQCLLLSIMLMTLSTVMIGLLPTRLPGGLSIILLACCRVLQGLSVGGEIPGAIVFVYEHAQHKQRVGFLLGILFLGLGLGAGLGAGINALIATYFSPVQMLAFAWRIPFLLAIILGVVGYVLRKNSVESVDFQKYIQGKLLGQSSHAHSMLMHLKSLLLGAGIVFFPAVLVSVGLYLPSYWMVSSSQASHQIFTAMMFGFLVTALFLPLFGYVGDRISPQRLYLFALLISLVGLPFLMQMLLLPSVIALYLFNLLYYFLIVMMAGAYPAILADLFPLAWRYRGVALAYAGTYSIAGTAPFVLSLLMHYWHSPNVLLLFFEGVGILSLFCGVYLLLDNL